MFTLKIYQGARGRIIEAAHFTTYQYANGAVQITAHGMPGREDECWFVGKPDFPLEDDRIYERAFIENSAGKTTERFFVLPAGIPAAA